MRVLEPLSWYEMYTVGPSDVTHWRSAWFVSMSWALQFAKLFEVSALGQVIAETPSFAAVDGGLKIAISVLKCNVPVEPKSTSASSPPTAPSMCASGAPWKTGALPNGAFHTFVWNSLQERAV